MLIGLFSHYFFGVAIFLTSVFLVLLVLVQRGRGGGLVGALGGPGGQSALGTKAGDVFTRITIVVATIWIFLCAMAVRMLNPSSSSPLSGLDDVPSASSLPGEGTTSSGTGGLGNNGLGSGSGTSGVGTGNVTNPLGTPIPPAPPAPASGSAPSSGTTPVNDSATPATATTPGSASPATTPATTTPPAETPTPETEPSADQPAPSPADADSSAPADAPK